MESITYEQSINYGGGKIAYSDEVRDSDITYYLENRSEPEDFEDDHYRCHDDLHRVCSIITGLRKGNPVPSFNVYVIPGFNFETHAVIYDGWHRIRAYQYLGYKDIPCDIIHGGLD